MRLLTSLLRSKPWDVEGGEVRDRIFVRRDSFFAGRQGNPSPTECQREQETVTQSASGLMAPDHRRTGEMNRKISEEKAAVGSRRLLLVPAAAVEGSLLQPTTTNKTPATPHRGRNKEWREGKGTVSRSSTSPTPQEAHRAFSSPSQSLHNLLLLLLLLPPALVLCCLGGWERVFTGYP